MYHISTEELDDIYAFAVRLGKDAGQLLLAAAKRRMAGGGVPVDQQGHIEKENSVDLVTETDEGM